MTASTPLSRAWAVGTAMRNRRADARGAERIDGLRVVSVGNLAVGGTGKTPVTSWIARLTTGAGLPTAILLRGYGDDEERLHGDWTPDVPVFANPDRVESAGRARSEGAAVAILDDGFQNRRLSRDLDVVLIAVEDPLPMRHLPAGPYRETESALVRADVIVLTRRASSTVVDAEETRDRLASLSAGIGEKIAGCVHLAPGDFRPLQAVAPIRDRLERPWVVTGIARPDAFLYDVEGRADTVAGVSLFADHHPFSRADAVRVRGRAGTSAIVMTEKDAVKLRSYARELMEAWVLTQSLEWDWGEAECRDVILRAVGSSGIVADDESSQEARA